MDRKISDNKNTRKTRKARKVKIGDEILEIINKSSYKLYDKQDSAEKRLRLINANIRLDYHGVLDIILPDIPIINENREFNEICVISFVGKFSKTREDVRKDIMLRITNNQIDQGILVFNKGKGKGKNVFIDVGGKAWVNKNLSTHKKGLFLDDSNEHIRSTKSLVSDEIIHSELFNSNDHEKLINKINKYC